MADPTAGAIRVSSFHFIAQHFISKLTFSSSRHMFVFGYNFQKTMLQNVFQSKSPFRKYSSHLVQHSTRTNLRVSRSNVKIKQKYYALTFKPSVKFPPKIKFRSDILTHMTREQWQYLTDWNDRTLRRYASEPWPTWAPSLSLWKLSSTCQKSRHGYTLRRMWSMAPHTVVGCFGP